MSEADLHRVTELHEKYASTFSPELSFVVGPLFRNLAALVELPESAEPERQRIYPTLVREFLILATGPNITTDFINDFADLLGLDINYLISTYAPEFAEPA